MLFAPKKYYLQFHHAFIFINSVTEHIVAVSLPSLQHTVKLGLVLPLTEKRVTLTQ